MMLPLAPSMTSQPIPKQICCDLIYGDMLCEAPGVIYGNEDLSVTSHILSPTGTMETSSAMIKHFLLLYFRLFSVPAAIIRLFYVPSFNLYHAWKVKSVRWHQSCFYVGVLWTGLEHMVLLACIHNICTITQVSDNSNVTTFCGLTVCHDWFSPLLVAAMFLCFHHHLYLSDKWRENSTEQYHPHTVSMDVHSVLLGAPPVCGVKCPLLVRSHSVGDGITSLSCCGDSGLVFAKMIWEYFLKVWVFTR